ncbi:unnamed protein product [Caenorhabditis nigoni]
MIMVCFKIVGPVYVSIAGLAAGPEGLRLFHTSVLHILATPSLVTIPYLFCNRRNVMEMKKRLSLKYLWSKIWNRNNRVGGIDNNQIAVAYIQSTHV